MAGLFCCAKIAYVGPRCTGVLRPSGSKEVQLLGTRVRVLCVSKAACPARERVRVASSLRVGWEEAGLVEGFFFHSGSV